MQLVVFCIPPRLLKQKAMLQFAEITAGYGSKLSRLKLTIFAICYTVSVEQQLSTS
jgi:hypothetical protein